MESELRILIGKYGMRAVHEGLMKEMRDTFQYLQDVFAIKNEIVHPMHNSVPTVEVVNDVIPEGVHTDSFKVEEDSLIEEETVTEMPSDPTIKQVVIANPKVAKAPVAKPKSPTDVKQLDKIEVEKKRQELLAKGIQPESVLTKENLQKWLAEGKSYMKIAKETGVKDTQVGAMAKSFGLASSVSKYIAIKKAAKNGV
jgi:hypothetical protein